MLESGNLRDYLGLPSLIKVLLAIHLQHHAEKVLLLLLSLTAERQNLPEPPFEHSAHGIVPEQLGVLGLECGHGLLLSYHLLCIHTDRRRLRIVRHLRHNAVFHLHLLE